MQTQLPADYLATSEGQLADSILRACVHCGFCTATCPTYQLTGDEDDGPRGRIYLIKNALEQQQASVASLQHLDRCTTCRSCETTCPSGVQYHRLLDIGRVRLEQMAGRSRIQRGLRRVLVELMTRPAIFVPLYRLGLGLRWLLPSVLRQHLLVPQRRFKPVPVTHSTRRVILLEGCVQDTLAPDINISARGLLGALNIEVQSVSTAQCCGAVAQHLSQELRAQQQMRRNIDAWWPLIEQGCEAIMAASSGCGVQLHDYGDLLSNDPLYAEKALRVSQLVVDPSSYILQQESELAQLFTSQVLPKLAFQAPCSLQHGLGQASAVEALLTRVGYELVPVADSHLCCGSAGTYSVMQPQLSEQLRDNKLNALLEGEPQLIATANIGCLNHLRAAADRPVEHWLVLLWRQYRASRTTQ